MNNKVYIIVAVTLLFTVSSVAQSRNSGRVTRTADSNSSVSELSSDDVEDSAERSAVRTTWLANSPGANWFVTLQGGMGYLGTENFRKIAFMDNLSFNGGLVLGKWFSPVWGLGLHTSASRSQNYATPADIWFVGENYPWTGGGVSGPSRTYIKDPAIGLDILTKSKSKPYNNVSGAYLYPFTYYTLGLDMMVNLRNLCGVYNPNAVINPVIYGGLGYVHTLADAKSYMPGVNGIMERFGLQFNFNITRSIALNLTFEDMIVPEIFDRHAGGDLTQDHVISGLLGITINFGDNIFHKAGTKTQARPARAVRSSSGRASAVPKSRIIDDECEGSINCELNALVRNSDRRLWNPKVQPRKKQVFTNNYTLSDSDSDSDESDDDVVEPEPPAKTTKTVRKASNAKTTKTVRPDYDEDDEQNIGEIISNANQEVRAIDFSKPFELTPVFFERGSARVRASQLMSIAKAAVYLDINAHATLEIAAFADKDTGNPQINLVLSKQRAQAVSDIITGKFGIQRDRYTVTYYGDFVQPFPQNNKNRVVLFLK
jgi:outer membrane protein OmpA-like peptidoglycan-associated protein